MTTPGYGEVQGERETNAYSGVRRGGDSTGEPGQYPDSLFGVAVPQGTGAGGTQGARYDASTDPTIEPGQLNEGLSGEGPSETADTGAPGSRGAMPTQGGPDSVSFTRPGSYLSGTYTSDTVSDSISGPGDWTQAIDHGYPGDPTLPGLAGNQPTSTGAGEGRTLRGGRAVNP